MLRHIDMNAAGSGGVASPADTANVANQKEACIALIQSLMNAALDRPPGDPTTGFSQRMGQAAVNVLLKRDTRPREVDPPPPPPPGSQTATTAFVSLVYTSKLVSQGEINEQKSADSGPLPQDPTAVMARIMQHAPDVAAFDAKVDGMRAAGCGI